MKDTKFERQQHEATGRHQGNIQRSLRGLHREQEHAQRDKARAQAEVARLNGLVPSSLEASTTSVATGTGGAAPTYEKRPEKKATVEDRKKQWEQLAAMGVALPSEARVDLGMAGEWKTVTKEIVGEIDEDGEFKAVVSNKGVRKRKMDEEEEEQEAAGEIITKRKGWGNTLKNFPGSKKGDDFDFEELLGKKSIPRETVGEARPEEGGVKKEELQDDPPSALADIPTAEEAAEAPIKKENGGEDGAPAPKITFKKRKKIAK